MLISWHEVMRIAPPIKGVIHIGAHRAQERNSYLGSGLTNTIWIEANPELAKWLINLCKGSESAKWFVNLWKECVFNYAVCDEDYAERDFHLANNDGESSSLLKPKEHIEKYSEVGFEETIQVSTIQLDTLIAEQDIDIAGYNFLNMDIQGAELLALRGMARTLPHMAALFTEVNFIEMYTNCALIAELDVYLAGYDFERRLTYNTGAGWGDALYINRGYL